MNPDYLVLEISATAFFIGAAVAALRRGRLPFFELISAAAFGILLEEPTSSSSRPITTTRPGH